MNSAQPTGLAVRPQRTMSVVVGPAGGGQPVHGQTPGSHPKLSFSSHQFRVVFGRVIQEDPERVLARRPPLDDPRISMLPELEARTPLAPPSSGRSDRQGAAD